MSDGQNSLAVRFGAAARSRAIRNSRSRSKETELAVIATGVRPCARLRSRPYGRCCSGLLTLGSSSRG